MNRVQKAFSILTVVALASCGSNRVLNTWDEIVNRGYVVVGLDDTFAPMGFRNTSGTLVGFDVDLAKLVFAGLEIEVRFQPIEWSAKVLELDAGNIDMIWNGLTITEPRRLEMLFSDPYIANRQIILTRSNSTIRNIADLSGKKLGTQLSSASETIVKANPIFNALQQYVAFDTFDLAIAELRAGTLDAVVLDEILGRYIISQTPNTFRVATENFGDETYGIGFRLTNTTIRDIVNDTLFDLIESGAATSISQTWFAENVFLPRES